MDQGQEGERVAEGAMNYVPQAEYLAGAGEEEDAFGEFGLCACYCDYVFETRVFCTDKTAQRGYPCAKTGGMKTEK